MDAILQHANESKLNFNVPKGQPLHNVWKSLWEQCEAANERLGSHTLCFPKSNRKSITNAMKMLTVFQNEIKGRESNTKSSDYQNFTYDLCENCRLSKSQQKLLGNNYDKRGKIVEDLLPQSGVPSYVTKGKRPSYEYYAYDEQLDNEESGISKDNRYMPMSTAFVQQRLYTQERVMQSKENSTKILVQLLSNFTKYDPNKDPFTNMTSFEDECYQHNLGPRESCLMMKLWLPSQMSVRLACPVARPEGGPQFWSNESHWGDRQDRLKALVYLVTGDEVFGLDILEDLKVTPQDDPWEFSRKFEQAYRLVMGLKDSSPPPAMLKALVNKFTFLDCATWMAASKEGTVDGIVKLVDKFRKNPHVKQTMMDQFCSTLYRESMADDKKPLTQRTQLPQYTTRDTTILSDEPQNSRYFSNEESAQIHPANDLDISEEQIK